jgi:hypothetical protein
MNLKKMCPPPPTPIVGSLRNEYIPQFCPKSVREKYLYFCKQFPNCKEISVEAMCQTQRMNSDPDATGSHHHKDTPRLHLSTSKDKRSLQSMRVHQTLKPDLLLGRLYEFRSVISVSQLTIRLVNYLQFQTL